jgi:hypothetical protein
MVWLQSDFHPTTTAVKVPLVNWHTITHSPSLFGHGQADLDLDYDAHGIDLDYCDEEPHMVALPQPLQPPTISLLNHCCKLIDEYFKMGLYFAQQNYVFKYIW